MSAHYRLQGYLYSDTSGRYAPIGTDISNLAPTSCDPRLPGGHTGDRKDLTRFIFPALMKGILSVSRFP